MRRIPGIVAAGPGETVGEKRGLGGRLVVISTVGPAGEPLDALCVRREPKNAARSEELSRTTHESGVRFHSTGAGGTAMRLDLTPETVGYHEEGVLDLEGRRS